MNLTILGWYVTVAGLFLGFAAILLSLLWHKLDNKADLYLTRAKQFWSEGNKIDGGKWHDKTNDVLKVAVQVRTIGVAVLYTAAIITLFGCLFLAIGSKP